MAGASLSLLCAVVGMVFVVVLLGLFKGSGNKKDKEANTPVASTKPKWQDWIAPVVITIGFAFFSTVFALFFLIVVWVMRLNPKTDSIEIPFPSDKDKKRAKGTYTWLLLSPFLHIIIFAIAAGNLSSRSSTNERVVAALLPLLIHLPVLFKLDSQNPFVFRHTQQAVFLLALRASTAAFALNIGKYPDDGIWFFFLANGFLWLFGSFWGRGQAHRGVGWWINRKGEIVLSPEAKTVEKRTVATPVDSTLSELLASLPATGNTPRQKALNAFRAGTPETRKRAVQILSQLSEVEEF